MLMQIVIIWVSSMYIMIK